MSKKWYPPYKCQYCQAKLYNKDYLYKVHLAAQERKTDKELKFHCDNCKAWFTYSVLERKTIEVSFRVDQYHCVINSKMPVFSVNKEEGYSFINILHLKYIPRNINPSNALEKLKLYLLFS